MQAVGWELVLVGVPAVSELASVSALVVAAAMVAASVGSVVAMVGCWSSPNHSGRL